MNAKLVKDLEKRTSLFSNSHNTFWGQKEIETDICPRETFNDSCTSVDKTMYVCLFCVFYTLGRNYTVYKRKRNDTKSRYKTIFFFLEIQRKPFEKWPHNLVTNKVWTKWLPVNSQSIKGWKYLDGLFLPLNNKINDIKENEREKLHSDAM